MNCLFILFCFLLFCKSSFGLISNGVRLGSFGDALKKIESSHKISSLACTTACDLSCNEDCDSCNSGCDDDCDGGCDSGCDFFWASCDSSCDSNCDSGCDDSCDSESCDSGCNRGCDETCGDEDAETEWLAYMEEYGDHIADKIIYTASDAYAAYICYSNSNNENNCTEEYISVYEDYLEDTFDKLEGIFVDDSYNTGLSLSVGWIDTDNSKSVVVGIMQTDNETLFTISESDRILSISNDYSYFGAIGFWWYYNDITELNNFDSQNVNISGCDWSMDLSMIFNSNTSDWEGLIYGFAFDDDGSLEFTKQRLNLTNIKSVTIDITDDVSNSTSSSSSSHLQVHNYQYSYENKLISNNNKSILSKLMNSGTMYIMIIIVLIAYAITLQLKMNGNKEYEYQAL